MNKLSLSMGSGDYEIIRPLKEGTVQAEGIDLTVLTDNYVRTVTVDRSLDVDMGVFSIWGYLWMVDQGMPWIGLPIFPLRRFRHGSIFINTSKGIKKPSDLAGKRIGGDFGGAICRWMTGILDEHYGVPMQSVSWSVNAGYGIDQSRGLPYNDRAKLKVEVVQPGKTGSPWTTDEMVASGELDALIADRLPPGFKEGDGRTARLFPDFREEEANFFKKTGVFPIIHTFKIKRELIDKHPWVATSICRALQLSKRVGYDRIRKPEPGALPLASYETVWDEQEALLGKDPWAYGIAKNRKPLEAAVSYAYKQGLIKKQYSLDELFVTVDESLFA